MARVRHLAGDFWNSRHRVLLEAAGFQRSEDFFECLRFQNSKLADRLTCSGGWAFCITDQGCNSKMLLLEPIGDFPAFLGHVAAPRLKGFNFASMQLFFQGIMDIMFSISPAFPGQITGPGAPYVSLEGRVRLCSCDSLLHGFFLASGWAFSA